ELVDDVSDASKRKGRRIKPTADASAEAVSKGRAPGDLPSDFLPDESNQEDSESFDPSIQPDAEPSDALRQSGAEAVLVTQGKVTKPTNMPDLILIDGGKGQLGMALAELKKLGLEHIPVIGLAKEFEEIYQPGKSEPLRLSHDTGALKLLQRVRDESHRFANTYNAQLRLKRISESILDEFPNIGDRRKAALLKKFGSVQRIRIATVEQIAEVPGFGGKAAGELKAFLEARSASQPT